MSYNKKAHLRANIDAIKIALSLDREGRAATNAERQVLRQYSGFGGLKCVLNPANSLADTDSWAKSEMELFPLVAELHQVIRDNTSSEKEYKTCFNSIKNSVLTAFYTPKPVTDALMDVLNASGIRPSHFLEPSAGTGTFLSSFKETMLPANITAFEKDLLTGKILSHLHPNDKIQIEGYEKMDKHYNGQFDVVASNIPFGDVAVFDPQLSNHETPAVRQSTKAIHNYFFTKSVQAVREGGIIAFITSQGVLNSENNKPVREYLMDTCNLVSAIRLPNNLFSDTAGTDVGSDLIILQKNTENRENRELNQRRQDFIESRKLSNGISINNLFSDFSRIVQTQSKTGTDPYGKPAIVFTYEGSTKELAESMRTMLYEDFSLHYNHRLYLQHKRDIPEQASAETVKPPLSTEEERYPDDLNSFWQAVEDDWFPDEKAFWEKKDETVTQTQVHTEQERKSTAQLDWEENSLGWDDVLTDEQLGKQYQPTQEDYDSFGEYAAESDNKLMNERPPQPEDYDSKLTREDYREIDEAVKAVRAGKWDEFVARRPYMRANTENTPKPEEKLQEKAKKEAVNHQATAISPSFGGGQGEVALSLYDLFGFSEQERSQVNTKKKGKRTQTISQPK